MLGADLLDNLPGNKIQTFLTIFLTNCQFCPINSIQLSSFIYAVSDHKSAGEA